MVKFLNPGKAVILLQGQYADHKAIIVRSFDDGTRDRTYGHCLVAEISKYPKKMIQKDSAKKQAKKLRVKTYVKLVNYYHIMSTRYTLDVDLKDVVTPDALLSHDKKVTATKEAKARLEESFKTGKNRPNNHHRRNHAPVDTRIVSRQGMTRFAYVYAGGGSSECQKRRKRARKEIEPARSIKKLKNSPVSSSLSVIPATTFVYHRCRRWSRLPHRRPPSILSYSYGS